MSKYEIENLKQIYLYNNVKETKGLCFPKNELAITEVLDAFCDCIPFERPDGYCIYKETLYLFEHFAIDSSVNDKGSSYMRQKRNEDNLYEKLKESNTKQKIKEIEESNLPEGTKKDLIGRYNQREQKLASGMQYEAFKDTPLYVQMFQDLDNASSSALKRMRDRLKELQVEWRNLDPVQLKEIQSRVLRDLKDAIIRFQDETQSRNLRTHTRRFMNCERQDVHARLTSRRLLMQKRIVH